MWGQGEKGFRNQVAALGKTGGTPCEDRCVELCLLLSLSPAKQSESTRTQKVVWVDALGFKQFEEEGNGLEPLEQTFSSSQNMDFPRFSAYW